MSPRKPPQSARSAARPAARSAGLGDLERAALEVLWAVEPGHTLTVRAVHEALTSRRDVAYTTVMTVLDRMAKKGLVTQDRVGRAFEYAAASTREEMTAELMRSTLTELSDQDPAAALVAFVGEASAAEREALRRALEQLDRA